MSETTIAIRIEFDQKTWEQVYFEINKAKQKTNLCTIDFHFAKRFDILSEGASAYADRKS